MSDPRVFFVTGASSGIGRATAYRLAARGEHLALVARGVDPLDETVAQCLRLGAASAVAYRLDVGDGEAVDKAVGQVLAEHGRLDGVVHSAAVVAYGRFDEVPAEVWDRVQRTNVLGSANVARAVLPHLRERDAGTLVLIGSVLGQIAVPSMSAYVVSKWAVRGLARELQLDNRDRPGVRISIVSPGGVDTPIYRQAANYLGSPGQPPPPVYSPERVAAAVVRTLDRPRNRVSVGFANPVMRLGFSLTPALFDLLVGPVFRLAATTREVIAPTTGNVLAPQPELEAVEPG